MTDENNFLGNKQDIFNHLYALMTGNGIKDANLYFAKIEVSQIFLSFIYLTEKHFKYCSIL